MLGELPQLPEELILAILEEAWRSPLSVSERINFMTSCRLVGIHWSRVFTHIAFRDLHIPSPRYLEHYQDIVLKTKQDQGWAHKKFNDICRSITVEASLFDATARMAGRDHDNLRTMVLVYHEFSADDIFNHWTYGNLPKQVESLELHFVGRANMKNHKDVFEPLSHVHRNVAWAIPNLRRLSIIGGDERFLRHFLPAIVYRDLAVLETDFPVELQDIDFKFGNHKSYTLPAKLEYRLIQT